MHKCAQKKNEAGISLLYITYVVSKLLEFIE